MKLEKLDIPGSVKIINLYHQWYNSRDETFGKCENLKSVSLLFSPEELIIGHSVYDDVFQHSARWPKTVRTLFLDRTLEKGIDMPGLEKLILGDSIQTVKVYDVYDLEELSAIKSYSLIPPELPNMSNAQYMHVRVTVPYEALKVYQQADVWKNFWNLEGFDPNAVEAEMVSMNFQEAELKIGEIVQLEATVLPEETTDKTLEWTSSNEKVAIVDESGLVTAIGEGSATITVTCGEASAQCEITVLEEDSVEELFTNPNSSISIYSVDGVIIKKDAHIEDLKNLVKGIYIIVSGENRYKISI